MRIRTAEIENQLDSIKKATGSPRLTWKIDVKNGLCVCVTSFNEKLKMPVMPVRSSLCLVAKEEYSEPANVTSISTKSHKNHW